MEINSEMLKSMFLQKGADICGIAPVSRFSGAPAGFHPNDIFSACKSVLVFACRFPTSSLCAKTNSPYTFVRNMMMQKCDMISFALSDELERQGIAAIPVPSSEPYDFWDAKQRQGRGILSLKHAAALAGLGTIGKNTLLINDKFGNMTWLGAVLLPLELEADPLCTYEGCVENCTICVQACPQHALDGTTLNQSRCREIVYTCSEGGGTVIACNLCRTSCPNHAGL